jgi:hypothetical protein
LSVWKTTEKKPILVTRKLFVEGISDLCWTKDGLKLLVSSRDGSLSFLEFNETELGKKQPNHLKKQYLNEVYGDIGDSFNISENPISLEVVKEPKKRVQPTKVVQEIKAVHMKDEKKRVVPKIVQQIETIKDGKRRIQPQQVETIKDGKRRIQPMTVASAPAENTKSLFDPINESDEEDDDFQEDEEEESEDEDLMQEENEDEEAQESEEVDQEESNSKGEQTNKQIMKKRPRNENAEKFIKRHKEDKLYFRINDKDEIKCTPKGNVEFIFDGAVKWTIPIKETILMATANSNFVAVIGASNSLHIFSNGVRLFPPIALSAEPVFIASNKKSDLVVLCQDSSLNVWNIANKECTVECTVDSLISKSEEGEIGNFLLDSFFR